MSGGPALAVALVTRDRREAVVRALDSVLPQLEPGDDLLVVDNASTDGTAEAVREWLARRRPAGRLVLEPVGGVSAARTAALADAGAGILCYLDDDETAEPGWLAGLRAAWAAAGPRVGCIGGPMRPTWGAPRPPWLVDHLLDVVSVLDLGGPRRRLDQTPRSGFVWGGNMSLRVAAAREVGGFRPDLGVSPGAPWIRGEDEELQERLVRAGWETWWDPGAAVLHWLEPERLTAAAFREVYRRRGLLASARGRSRLAGLAALARGSLRYAVLAAARRPAAPSALFTVTYGWTLLTVRRPRLPAPPPGAARARPS